MNPMPRGYGHLLRYDTETRLSEVMNLKPIVTYAAHCSSVACNNGEPKGYGKRKNVERKIIDCPDCGSALYWKMDNRL